MSAGLSSQIPAAEIRLRFWGGCSICGRQPVLKQQGSGWLCEHAATVSGADICRAWPGTFERGPTRWTIYKITCIPEMRSYIGQTKRSIASRWEGHIDEALIQTRKWLLSDAIRQHGAAAFSIEALMSCKAKEEADECEAILIEQERTFAPNGFNLTKGGAGRAGMKMDDEWKAAQSRRLTKIAEDPDWLKGVSDRSKERWAGIGAAERTAIIRRGHLNRSSRLNDPRQGSFL